MYRIKPYNEYIQSELIQFMNAEPNQWQAKVIACLGFKVIYSFEEITSKLSLSQVFVLKTLLVAEKYHIVTYTNDGWIINSHLDVNYLNEFLALDIPDYDIGSSKRMSYLLEHGSLNKQKEISAEPILTDSEKKQSVDVVRHTPIKAGYSSPDSFDDIIESSPRPVDGSGRKRNKEWNQNEALSFGRQLQKIIQERNEAERVPQSKPVKELTRKQKRNKILKMTASKDEIASEQLYIKLCTLYPEYEAFITRHHEKDHSYKMMKLIEKKILSDYEET